MNGLHYDFIIFDEENGGNMFKVKKYKVTDIKKIEYPKYYVEASQFIDLNDDKIFLVGLGEAHCDSNDKFNEGFGYQLARTRATINLLKDYEKQLISLAKQPEWRKEKKKDRTGDSYHYKELKEQGSFYKPANMYFFNGVDATHNISNIDMLSNSEKELIQSVRNIKKEMKLK